MRVFRLIATPVLLLSLLGLLIWGGLWGWSTLTAPLPGPSPTPCVSVQTKVMTVRDVHVRVFNGGFTSGLARQQSQRLSAAGFKVIKTTNTDERVSGTVIRSGPDGKNMVRLVASYFVEPKIETDDRVDGTVDVLVGSDFKGKGPKPISQISIDGGVCLPPSPSPSTTR